MYADVLFEVIEPSIIDDFNDELQIVAKAIKENPTWINLIFAPYVTLNDKYSWIINLGLIDMLSGFLMILIKNNHFHHLSNIAKFFQRRLDKSRKIANISLYTPKLPSNTDLEIIKRNLTKYFNGYNLKITQFIDSSLIQGYKVYYDGQLIENSVKKYLKTMFESVR